MALPGRDTSIRRYWIGHSWGQRYTYTQNYTHLCTQGDTEFVDSSMEGSTPIQQGCYPSNLGHTNCRDHKYVWTPWRYTGSRQTLLRTASYINPQGKCSDQEEMAEIYEDVEGQFVTRRHTPNVAYTILHVQKVKSGIGVHRSPTVHVNRVRGR